MPKQSYIYVVPADSDSADQYALEKGEAYVFATVGDQVYTGVAVALKDVPEEIAHLRAHLEGCVDAIVSWSE